MEPEPEHHPHEEELKELRSLTTRMKEVSDSLVAKVDARLEELRQREEKWKKIDTLLVENYKKIKTKVVLDVGGKRFATFKDTLLSHHDTYFTALLQSGRYQVCK